MDDRLMWKENDWMDEKHMWIENTEENKLIDDSNGICLVHKRHTIVIYPAKMMNERIEVRHLDLHRYPND